MSHLPDKMNKWIFKVPFDDIKSGEVTRVLSALQSMLSDRNTVLARRATVTLLFEGYDDDPRDVYDIPDIRRYAKNLDERFPYWFYFADLHNGTLELLALCLCRVIKVPGGSTPDRDDLNRFLVSHIAALNHLCDRFALGNETRHQVTNEALARLVSFDFLN